MSVKIVRDEHGPFFEFVETGSTRTIRVEVDFTPRQNIGGRADLLARAIGFKRGRDVRVLDATAGLCRDSFHFYSLGCNVLAIENNREIFSVVQARAEGRLDKARFQIVQGDAVELMPRLAAEREFDVVFLDPIFQEKKKSAKASKESQVLRELVAPPPAADEFALLKVALETARERVVVKRALHAPTLCDEQPGKNLRHLIKSRHAIKGKAVRYDVYVSLDFGRS